MNYYASFADFMTIPDSRPYSYKVKSVEQDVASFVPDDSVDILKNIPDSNTSASNSNHDKLPDGNETDESVNFEDVDSSADDDDDRASVSSSASSSSYTQSQCKKSSKKKGLATSIFNKTLSKRQKRNLKKKALELPQRPPGYIPVAPELYTVPGMRMELTGLRVGEQVNKKR